MSSYEFWLTDDYGVRLAQIQDHFFFSYTRSLIGFGTLEIGISYDKFAEKILPVFRPDRRIEVWRSPADDYPLRLERIYFLRRPKMYQRKEDDVKVIVLYGRDSKDLLARKSVIQFSGTSYASKTDYIDDMMKAIVREQMTAGTAVDENGVSSTARAYPSGLFAVQSDVSLGPSITRSFADKNVLDILKELRDTSFQLYASDPLTYRKIYFDVFEVSIKDTKLFILDAQTLLPILDTNGYGIEDARNSDLGLAGFFGFEFRTIPDIYGKDRTSGIIFSVENGNLEAPWYSISHYDEVNSVYVKGQGRGESRAVRNRYDSSRIGVSAWNRSEAVVQATYETSLTALDSVGDLALSEGSPIEEIYATFINSPGDEDKPRSLYGLDWDLGDILPVNFAGIQINCEVVIIYVSVDENRVENVMGRNTVS